MFETVLKKYPAEPPPKIGITNDFNLFLLAILNTDCI